MRHFGSPRMVSGVSWRIAARICEQDFKKRQAIASSDGLDGWATRVNRWAKETGPITAKSRGQVKRKQGTFWVLVWYVQERHLLNNDDLTCSFPPGGRREGVFLFALVFPPTNPDKLYSVLLCYRAVPLLAGSQGSNGTRLFLFS